MTSSSNDGIVKTSPSICRWSGTPATDCTSTWSNPSHASRRNRAKSLRPPKENTPKARVNAPLIRQITHAYPFCRVPVIHEQLGEGAAETHLSAAAKVEAL